eukprot:9700163-Ditylum_brightwellii.AAC.1
MKGRRQYNKVKDKLTSLPHAQYIQWTDVKHLIFAHPSPGIRSLSALATGCDVFMGSIKNLGPAKLQKALETIENDDNNTEGVYKCYMRFICEKGKLEEDAVETFIKALLCEPANDAKTRNAEEEASNVNNGNIPIVDGPTMLTCVGPGNGDHLFLEAEGNDTCALCNACI